MNTRRRNGKPASCEPCRKDKVRCDHRLPVCTRCQRRSIPARCFYHPAPLTRTSDRSASPQSSPLRMKPPGTAHLLRSATRELSPHGTSVHSKGIQGIKGIDESLPSYWVGKAVEVLGALRDLLIIWKLVREYYNLSQAVAIPAPFILQALDQMPANGPQLREISVMSVLQNTSRPLKVAPDWEGKTFHELYTGPHLRLEIIGILCALAGKASCFALAQDQFPRDTEAVRRVPFPKRMMMISESVLQICNLLTPTNDLTVWALHQNLLLSTMVYGDSSSEAWHCLGELSTSIFELGIHRDSGNLPPFLRESRRRSFASVYQLDKGLATFLGRPPRICQRHSDCKPPLDLGEDCLAADSAHLQLAVNALDEDGWNPHLHGTYHQFREEILEWALKDPSPETARHLRDIAIRCRRVWESLPTHLHFRPSCWTKDLPVSVSLMLTVSYLAYLYNDFLIQRLLLKQDPSAEGSLFNASATILSTVLIMGRHREPTVDIRQDFLFSILLYWFPSASVLVKALQEHTRNGQPLPFTGSRAAIIRDLTVFTAHLDTIAESDYVHAELLTRASKVFLRIIDEVIDPRAAIAPLPPGIDDLPEISIDGFGISDDMGVVFDQWIF
ncbi:hypothetical protein BO70DRAFT_390167 [Aspergillus heteromorphus CBS 117.55]|uniref:Zn(2)-C6 fungal-type domain-containing protein n=1 Tax=Aspergillus heteromorphus CBS 117.55 TaxID=1448321 RepID=A0A317V7N7_9EURO|nr:uncharacterized protein BO70DRAFT_390167 [Aspergillus heteromorphus CBS 117.55]PWY69058.1 hypothetical protein BO70DRAFT_390167 [Aspergillus heteromorphus CBS 117.55]